MSRPTVASPQATAPLPYPVLYRSPRFVVIAKPPGLPVHPGPRSPRSVEDIFPAISRRKDGPWLAHRLDADTSGCLLIALRKQGLLEAQACFQSGHVRKTYWAVVAGRPQKAAGEIDTPLARQDTPRGWRMVASPCGQKAHTRWRVLASHETQSWLELELLTGRTHQARVHCALLGCPILGDPIYGEAGPLLHLMSRRLELQAGEEVIRAEAVPAPHMAKTLSYLGWREA
ncbi:RluA family pseudouridine synthase [Kozakia baliensis]|uniref:RNA pseudouridine synthase n=1 Tax=Kozakia baliensis TaxID=153496 RepID=A0A1D8UQ81_9PROT|nr:RNA pseudouridine synthase [Kozakia baliensis]AOX15776.1 RNA pseudouridine synthase [Kozakia baliensis]GBR24080.1 ribosomal RNA large subunit 23S rRNA pseudouridine synthase A [Kozakia baliensis NRIC 0488]GEL64616.1 RNA pseudouridine synthase [Kozakia baliensis]